MSTGFLFLFHYLHLNGKNFKFFFENWTSSPSLALELKYFKALEFDFINFELSLKTTQKTPVLTLKVIL